jgi:cytochrome c-type biogenesis protein CcmE
MTNEPNEQQSQEQQPTPVPMVAPTARTSTLMGPRAKLAFAFILVSAALAYFAFTAFEGATVDYLSVAQVYDGAPTADDRQVGVTGKLVQDSYVRDADGLTAHFSIKDEDGVQHLDVVYSGEIGQVFFNDHSEIILQGQKMVDGSFSAENLTVRCPSKYLTESEQADIDAQNNGDPLAPPYQLDYFDKEA